MTRQLPGRISLILGYCSITIFAGLVSAEEPLTESYMVPPTPIAPTIDGELAESAWSSALQIELPFEVNPAENSPAPVRTECLLTHDESRLYIAFRAYDPEPNSIRAHLSDRDDIRDDDFVGVYLDTFNDERRAFCFFSNPLGVQWDRLRSDGMHHQGDAWDAIWDSAARLTDWGYTVEMEIPFNQLRFQRSNGDLQIWGFDAERYYPRTQRSTMGSFPRERGNNCYLCQALKIQGFAGVTPGNSLELNPTITTVRTDERSELPDGEFQQGANHGESGLTASWGLTPNLCLAGTVNPDFSQIEADARQLDINEPFALFFAEKRPFFTEGADFFHTRLRPVHTRTLREPIWGSKLTGKEGDHTIGAFVVRDELTNLLFPGSEGSASTSLDQPNTATVLRYKRDIGSQHTVGAMITDRNGDDYHNRLAGFDGEFRLSTTDQISLQLLGSTSRYPEAVAEEFDQKRGEFSDIAMHLQYQHRGRNWGYWAFYRGLGRDFRADLGFRPQVDIRHYNTALQRYWVPEPNSWFTWLQINLGVNYEEDQAGNELHKGIRSWGGYWGPMNSRIFYRARRIRTTYEGKPYDQTDWHLSTGLKPSGCVSFYVDWDFGDRIDYANSRLGRRFAVSPDLVLRLGRHLCLNLNHTFEQMRIEKDRLYTANVSQGSLVFQFNSRTFLRTILQYVDYDYNVDNYLEEQDPQYSSLFAQLLFSYKVNPRTVLFLGYAGNYLAEVDYPLTASERTVFMKLGYAWQP